MSVALSPNDLNSWLTKGLAPLTGLGMAIFLTITKNWGPWAVPIILGLVFGPGVAGLWANGKSDDKER